MPEPINVDHRYAGFWIRAGATLIDIVILLAITWPLLIWIYGADYLTPNASQFVRGPMDFLLSYVLPTVAALVFWKYRSATPGKIVLRLKIVDARTGGQPSLGQFVIRYFAYLISTLPLGLGFLWIAMDPRKQAFHDKLAGTLVVRAKPARQKSLASES
jgi:uncharacterized RDD family membrane protein YckC